MGTGKRGISPAWDREGFLEEVMFWVELILGKMSGKDIPLRNNNISKMLGEKIVFSGSFRNGQFGDVIYYVLGPHFHSVGQRFSQCVQSNPSVSQELQGTFLTGRWGPGSRGIGPGSDCHP